ncbi:hypothetical protein NQZ68_007352 [Dissostichus eleginoides]|nr:hypothetical protein NQZ68_007352 [Dissostichus eleginoides]
MLDSLHFNSTNPQRNTMHEKTLSSHRLCSSSSVFLILHRVDLQTLLIQHSGGGLAFALNRVDILSLPWKVEKTLETPGGSRKMSSRGGEGSEGQSITCRNRTTEEEKHLVGTKSRIVPAANVKPRQIRDKHYNTENKRHFSQTPETQSLLI